MPETPQRYTPACDHPWRTRLSPKAGGYHDATARHRRLQRGMVPRLHSRPAVTITAYPPTRRTVYLDKRSTAVLDALVQGWVRLVWGLDATRSALEALSWYGSRR